MNQGATAHRDHYVANRPVGSSIDAAALAEVIAETSAIRERLSSDLFQGTLDTIQLGSDLYLPRGYEAGSIAAVSYDLADLPAEHQLRADLQRFLSIYQEAVVARSAAIAAAPEKFNVPAPPPDSGVVGSAFQPKDSSDYLAWVAGHQQTRTRKHEHLVNSFAAHSKAKGWTPITKGAHPRDLLLERADEHLLVEAKTVRANSEFAVREAIGQLFTYEFIYYPTGARKAALFSAPVGDLWINLLAHLEIM